MGNRSFHAADTCTWLHKNLAMAVPSRQQQYEACFWRREFQTGDKQDTFVSIRPSKPEASQLASGTFNQVLVHMINTRVTRVTVRAIGKSTIPSEQGKVRIFSIWVERYGVHHWWGRRKIVRIVATAAANTTATVPAHPYRITRVSPVSAPPTRGLFVSKSNVNLPSSRRTVHSRGGNTRNNRKERKTAGGLRREPAGAGRRPRWHGARGKKARLIVGVGLRVARAQKRTTGYPRIRGIGEDWHVPHAIDPIGRFMPSRRRGFLVATGRSIALAASGNRLPVWALTRNT